MADALKPELLPLEQYLFPDLPTIVGNVDYQTLHAQLVRINQILIAGGVERDFIERSLELILAKASPRYRSSAKYQRLIQEHSARALRCNIVRVLLKLDFRELSVRLADSALLQRFVGIARLDEVRVPSKSTLQRYEQWLPESELRPIIEKLLVLAASDEAIEKLDLAEPVAIDVCYVDMTCVKADIHFPTDWVLLKDAVHTLMAAVELIRRAGLKSRMEPPKVFRKRINQLCIEMTQSRRKLGHRKHQKKTLRLMKRQVSIVRHHAQRHRNRLEKNWTQTELKAGQVQQILQRIDNVLEQLPAAVRQAHERLIGERKVSNADKILSLYEPDAHVIVRGKAGAEVEFGNTLVLGEADDGLIVDWKLIQEQAQADCKQIGPSLARMQAVFGDRIQALVGDRGCDSEDNRQSLEFVKVQNGIAPKNPQQLKARMSDPLFAGWHKRRSQTEARIAIFKRQFLGTPLRSRGFEHRELMVTWAVLVHNLWMLARRPRASDALAKAA